MKKLARKIAHIEKSDSAQIYNFRSGKYANIRNGSICMNSINYNGFFFNNFECPIVGFDFAATHCCGRIFEHYCCTEKEVENDKRGFYNPYNEPTETTANGNSVKISFLNFASYFYAISYIFYY